MANLLLFPFLTVSSTAVLIQNVNYQIGYVPRKRLDPHVSSEIASSTKIECSALCASAAENCAGFKFTSKQCILYESILASYVSLEGGAVDLDMIYYIEGKLSVLEHTVPVQFKTESMSSGHYMHGVTLTLLSNDGSEDIVLGGTKSGSGILVVEEMFTPGNNYTVKADYDHYYPEEVKFLVNETANAVVFRMQAVYLKHVTLNVKGPDGLGEPGATIRNDQLGMSTTTGQHGAARLSVPANVELLLVNVTSAGREPVRDREIPIPVNSLGVEETISMDMALANCSSLEYDPIINGVAKIGLTVMVRSVYPKKGREVSLRAKFIDYHREDTPCDIYDFHSYSHHDQSYFNEYVYDFGLRIEGDLCDELGVTLEDLGGDVGGGRHRQLFSVSDVGDSIQQYKGALMSLHVPGLHKDQHSADTDKHYWYFVEFFSDQDERVAYLSLDGNFTYRDGDFWTYPLGCFHPHSGQFYCQADQEDPMFDHDNFCLSWVSSG